MPRTRGHGNPKWTRDETLLALALYFESGSTALSKKDPRVQALSLLLNSLPIHPPSKRNERFRNADGVGFKLQNIRQLDTGKGLANVSRLDRELWNELGTDPERAIALAGKIRRVGVALAEKLDGVVSADPGDEGSSNEGAVLVRFHKYRERDRKLRAKLLKQRRKTIGLRCEMCHTAPPSRDPSLDDAIFETHHLIPLARAEPGPTYLKDLALLCASCHRLLHRLIRVEKRWFSPEDGRQFLEQRVRSDL